MGYKRHIVTSYFPFHTFSFAVDENRAAFRLLVPAEESELENDAYECDVSQLKTTDKLGSIFVTDKKTRWFLIGGERFVIYAEVIIDKTLPEFQRMWIPGAHFVSYLKNGRFQVDIKGGLTFFDHRNTAEHCRRSGGIWPFDLWVRDVNAPVSDCSWSITTTQDSTIITNVADLGEEWAADDVMTGTTSKWLNLAYELTPSSTTVEPDGWVTFTLKVLDGRTEELAEDVTWDNFIIEPVDGYCPHRRVAVTNGIGSFRMKAQDLLAGEKMRVKVGVRFWVSRVEATVDVVAND